MYDNITIFYKDAEIIITPFSAGRVIKLLKKRIANGEETAQNYTFLADAYLAKKDNKEKIESAHMLLALTTEPNSLAMKALEQLGVDAVEIKEGVKKFQEA